MPFEATQYDTNALNKRMATTKSRSVLMKFMTRKKRAWFFNSCLKF